MAELRQNAVTGRWVAVAPVRGGRPVRSRFRSGARDRIPEWDPECPFCPGNEEELPEILWELAGPDEPGWRCRAVPNRYAAFHDPGVRGSAASASRAPVLDQEASGGVEPGRTRPADGVQEVLVESHRHDRDPGRMTGEELEAVIELYAGRLERLVGQRPGFTPILFRNHGPEAGASLVHPHAQLIATEAVPPRVARRERRMRGYHRTGDGCLLCRLPELEPEAGARTVAEGEHFRAFVPWAPERSLEVWLAPRRHAPGFHQMGSEERLAFGLLLGRVLSALRILAGDVDYNYIVHTAAGARSSDPALHWFVQIRPITARMAGFELGSGALILAADPVEDAGRIRGALDGPAPDPDSEGAHA